VPSSGVRPDPAPAPGATGSRPGPDFDAVRQEFELPAGFPPEALAEAEAAAARAITAEPGRIDATDIELVTIDPPGSKDLDQAVGIERVGRGFRVHYAIADVGAVVTPGGALDAEVRRRGQTIYLPDGSVPLHPPVLSEQAASLLPDGPRRAVLWTIDLDADGAVTATDVRRAVVASRARLDYAGVQAQIDAREELHPAIAALPEVGRLRRAAAVARGAIELELPEQEIVQDDDGWTLRVRARLPVEDWNAEISLLAGTVAADMMLRAGIGLLRTLPAPDAEAVAGLRRAAERLGFDWPDGASAAEVLAGLPDDGSAPVLALRRAATTLLRGAGYAAFGAGAAPPPDPGHGGIGAPYAHVTAPLRRLVDRFGTEICLAVAAGRTPDSWLLEALPQLPDVMSASDSLAGRVARACLDRTEAARLAGRVGETFEVIVLRAAGPEGEPGEVYLPDPAVIARCAGAPKAGVTVAVTLTAADPSTGRVLFTAIDQ